MGILKILKENGYGKQAEILNDMKKDSIRLITEKSDETEFKIGESKIGGYPHLPADFEWPMFNDKPLAFLAQINLEQVSEHDLSNLLPNKGMLYMFHEGG